MISLATSVLFLSLSLTAAGDQDRDFVAGPLIQLNDNGAWSWFMDERAIIDRGKLIVGSVRAVGTFQSGKDDPRWGNVEVSVLDLASGGVKSVVLHAHFEQDDHDGPALFVRPDGRYLAVYSKHAVERKFHARVSEPGDPLTWGPASEFLSPGGQRGYGGDNVTYSNLFPLKTGQLFNFYRGPGHEPNYATSDDWGKTWTYGGHLLKGKGGYSPYLKYAFDGRDTLHFVATEDHPRNYDNSIYHGFISNDFIHLSDGTPKVPLSKSIEPSLPAWDLTKVFAGDPDNVGWVIDLELDKEKRPYLGFSVQKDGRGLPRGKGGMDHRFFQGRWDGASWRVHEVAFAGTRLYPGEDDYTGLLALDPNSPDIVYISTDAEPKTGVPLISKADGKRHRELFRGTTADAGRSWTWEAITANSTMDNLRPLVPRWEDPRTALVWMRGDYKNNHGEWTTAVVATILDPRSGR